jgi:hypothetical protein
MVDCQRLSFYMAGLINAVFFAKNYQPPISRRLNRMLHLGVGVIMLCGLALCALIQPDPSGIGTHKQLGLPGCLICRVTGMKHCPSCGLTTGFAHVVRGRWIQAQATHPAAIAVFIIWCLMACYCLVIAALGINWLIYEISASAIVCTTGFLFWIMAL